MRNLIGLFKGRGFRFTLLVLMVVVIGVSTACSAGSLTRKTGDNAHAFKIRSAQIIDQIDGDIPAEGEIYLVVEYEVENLRNQNDSFRRWTDQIIVVVQSGGAEQSLESVLVDSLANQLWETSLLRNERKSGYIVFATPDNVTDINLTFTFPDSGNEEIYALRPMDRRINENIDFVLTSLERRRRTQKIPVVGGILTSITSFPIRYLGNILIPVEELAPLLEQTNGLPDGMKRKILEQYLLTQGLGSIQ